MARRLLLLSLIACSVSCTVRTDPTPTPEPVETCTVEPFTAREGASDAIAVAPMASGAILAVESDGAIYVGPHWSQRNLPWLRATFGVDAELSPMVAENGVLLTFRDETGRTAALVVDANGNLHGVADRIASTIEPLSTPPRCACSEDAELEVWVAETEDGVVATIDAGRIFDIEIDGVDPTVVRDSDTAVRIVTRVGDHDVRETSVHADGTIDTDAFHRSERIVDVAAFDGSDTETWFLTQSADGQTAVQNMPYSLGTWTEEGREPLALAGARSGRGGLAAIVLGREEDGSYSLRAHVVGERASFFGDIAMGVHAEEPPVPVVVALDTTFLAFWREDDRVVGVTFDCDVRRGI